MNIILVMYACFLSDSVLHLPTVDATLTFYLESECSHCGVVPHLFATDRPDAEAAIRSVKDSTGKMQHQKPLNRKFSYLKDSPSCLALANRTSSTPGYRRVLGVWCVFTWLATSPTVIATLLAS
jgi:hypothetical protein